MQTNNTHIYSVCHVLYPRFTMTFYTDKALCLARKLTCTHSCADTSIHAYALTNIFKYQHIHIYTRTCSNMCTHACTYTYTSVHTYVILFTPLSTILAKHIGVTPWPYPVLYQFRRRRTAFSSAYSSPTLVRAGLVTFDIWSRYNITLLDLGA